MSNVSFFPGGNNSMTKMVLFDFDGVLANTEEIGYRVMSEMLAEQGIHYTREAYVEMLSGITYEAFHKKLRELHPDLPESFRAELHERLREASDSQIQVIDGVKELLKNLRDNNIPYAVCSNSGSESLLHKLHKTGLFEDFVPNIYSRHHVENAKPAPDMYLLAARKQGVAPKDCIVVEDSMTGTMAGVAAGMNVIGFVGEAHRESFEAQLLERAGAKMIGMSMAEVWDHISRFAGVDQHKPLFTVTGPAL